MLIHLVHLIKRKRKTWTLHAPSEPIIDTPENPNNISISDAETQSGNEPETRIMLMIMFMMMLNLVMLMM